MIFERPIFLWLVPVIAVVFYLLTRYTRNVRIRAATAWSRELGARAAARGRSAPLLFMLLAVLASIGLAGPRWGLASQAAESRALNVVLVMDISRSMLAQDAVPDRLTRSIQVARRLIQDLPGDRLGLVAFAARPYLLSPLTLDPSAVSLQLDALDPSVASEGGSAIGAALALAHDVLTQASEGGDRAIVLLTDGESFEGEGEVTSAAGALGKDRIALITIPTGSTEGARIPDPEGGWHRDDEGQVVVTRRDTSVLNALTGAAQGVLLAPDAPDPAGQALRTLDRLNRAAVRDQLAADLVSRSWWFAAAALFLLVLYTVRRRTAALIGIALCASTSLAAQRPSDAMRVLSRGDTTAALSLMVQAAKARTGDTLWFNAGTAALVQGDLPSAIASLERSTTSLDPDLRRRSLYNLGTAMLIAARRDSTGRDSLATGAARNLREALSLSPGDSAAKYNYELARRMMRTPPPPQNGGGKGPPPPPASPSDSPRQPGQMSPSEAEQVLNAMDRAERETRRELAKKQRHGAPPGGPDW